MKRFLIKCAAFAVALILPFAAYFAYVQMQPAAYNQSLMGGASHKQMLLETTPSPKIVIVGGSGAPYAVISAQMQQAFGMPCINLGATAYLGLEFYFAQLRGNVNEGDIIIIAPEYSMYENVIDYETVWMAVENHFNSFVKLPLSYIPQMATSFWRYARAKLTAIEVSGSTTDSYEKQYSDGVFSYWGDITTPRESLLESKYNTSDTRAVSADILTPEAVKALNSFNAYAKRHGASVYLTYATFDRLALTSPLTDVDALQNAIEAQCNIPWLGALRDGVMDENYFYNSNNHLTSEGAKIRTDALIKDLQAALSQKAKQQ